MRTHHFRTAFLLLPFSIVAAHAAPIQNLTFTEVIKDVFVIDPATKQETPAKSGDKLVPPNVLKTGADSRAELIAEDKTVTRVGSNTIFSVEANSRDVNLAQGSVLFHSPAGRGGGRIKSAGATASVLGTTLAVSANSDGGFKTSLLEGKGEVKDPKGGKVGLVAGQVTFAKPGGGLSPALNFDLKAQIANSKLVGGFSTPLASIAKIEAAVAVQQAKISGGGLVSTGMLIGDRPDAAFKVDATIVDGQIRQAQTRRIEREKAEKERQRFFPVDPRFEDYVLDDTRNSLVATSETASSERFFYINQTARTVWRDYLDPLNDGAIVGVPKNLPGNRLDSSYVFYPIIQRNISITLPPSQDNPSRNSAYFFPIPIDPFEIQPPDKSPLTAEKLSGGLVALDDIKLTGNIDFIGFDSVKRFPDEPDPTLALLLSAGRTIKIAEGSEITATASDFQIYSGGTQFSRDLALQQRALQAGETPVALSLSAVSIQNNHDSSSPNGTIWITAPEIQLTNTEIRSTISAGTDDPFSETETNHSKISLVSAGLMTIKNDAGLLAKSKELISKTPETSKSIFLGFQKPEDICLTAYKIGITSTSSTVELTSVNFEAKQVTLDAADGVSLVDVVISAPLNEGSQLDVKGGGNVVVRSSNPDLFVEDKTGAPNRSWISPALSGSNIVSRAGSVTLENTLFGDPGRFDGKEPSTSELIKFEVRAATELLLNSTAINADVVLFEGKTVKVAGVTVVPNDLDKSSITVNSDNPIHISGVSSFTAYDITFDAKNQMVLTTGGAQTSSPNPDGEFRASAVNDVTMKGVDLRYAQSVALDANTVVLGDVAFKEGSTVSLKSGAGVLSTPADRNGITKGWVNVLPRVTYGPYDLHDLNGQMGNAAIATARGTSVPPSGATAGTPTVGIPGANLGAAVKAQFNVDLPNLTVGKR